MLRKTNFFVALLFLLPLSLVAEVDHSAWDELLKRHVIVLRGGSATQVHYAALLQDRPKLQQYLNELAVIDRTVFDLWPVDDQLAFLINAYNAWTVELILSEYPQIDSIRDIGFLPGSAWRREFVSLFGEQVSLDDIEHTMIRGWDRFQEPRIHFAVNCAATGCPALRAEAFVGDRLEWQLEDNTKLFLTDRSRNFVKDGRLTISRIFDWYEEDFERGWGRVESVQQFLGRYCAELELTKAQCNTLQAGEYRVRYSRYDWSLNRVSNKES